MKSKINIVLPIALAIVLPGLSIYTNMGEGSPSRLGFLGSWITSSFVLYSMWWTLWYAWDTKSHFFSWRLILALFLFHAIIILALYFSLYNSFENFKWVFIGRITLASILFLAIQYSLKTQDNIANLLLEKEQMQTENYKSQLKVLRAQVDPHFLFNSLNTLRSMVRQQHVNSEKFIMSLSDFYRQTLKHNENTTLRLSEELAVLESYLFLMKNRNEEAISVSINIDEAVHEFHLPALALQVVAENCFKHNSMTSRNPLFISISNTDDYYIEVTNNIQARIGKKDTSGFGLEILRKRYELMKVQQGVLIEATPEQFSVKLKLIF